MPPEIWIALSVLIGSWLIARSIEVAAERTAKNAERANDALWATNKQLDRIGTKLDNIWSPLMGINDKLWGRGDNDA